MSNTMKTNAVRSNTKEFDEWILAGGQLVPRDYVHEVRGGEDEGFLVADIDPWGWLTREKRAELTRLFAAAPQLLAALDNLQSRPNDPAAHRMALDALAKAGRRT